MKEECWCSHCDSLKNDFRSLMNLCPICGNKRCPKSTWHENECSGSNESGQAGSIYGPKAHLWKIAHNAWACVEDRNEKHLLRAVAAPTPREAYAVYCRFRMIIDSKQLKRVI